MKANARSGNQTEDTAGKGGGGDRPTSKTVDNLFKIDEIEIEAFYLWKDLGSMPTRCSFR